MSCNFDRCLILNANAGGVADVKHLISHFIEGTRCAFRMVNSPEKTYEVIERAVQDGASRIIIAGGDGTINVGVNSLNQMDADIELAIVPLGTGNDLARSLDIPRNDPVAAFELATTGTARPIDLIRIGDGSDGLFVNACSAGFAGKVCASIDAETKRRWGGFAYWITSIAMLGDLPQYSVRVTLDDRSFEKEVHCLVVANGRYVGGGFPIAPAALVDDGLVNITVVPVELALDLLTAGLEFMRGRPERNESLLRHRSRRVRIASDPPMPFSVDGERKERLVADFEVLPGAVRVVTGRNPPGIIKSPGQ